MSGTTFPSTFTANERANSQPVTCYTFIRRDTVWRYTDQPEDVTVDGVTYRAAVIAHGDLEKDDESAAGELTVTLSRETPIVSELQALNRDGYRVTCTIRQTHRVGIGGVVTLSTAIRFKGGLLARTLKDGACEFRVASLAALFDRPILRVIASPTCNHTVYDTGCGVDPVGFTTTGCTVSAISGLVLTVTDAASQADGYYTAGYLVVEAGSAAEGERIFIQGHVGSALTCLTALPPGLAVSDTVAITAGCDGLEATCTTKFSNLDYFLGFPRVPQVNPFEQAV